MRVIWGSSEWKRGLFVLPLILSLSLVIGYPLIYLVNLSFRQVDFANLLKGGSPWVGFANYNILARDPLFSRMLLNTVIFWGGSISFQFLIGLGLALLFAKRFPLNGLYRSLILLPWFIPLTVSCAFWKWALSGETGIINAYLLGLGVLQKPIPWLTSPRLAIYSLTLANVWLGIPFNFIMLFTGLQAIPTELYESARVDGARESQIVWYITLPLLKPTIIVTLLLGTIYTIKVFDLVWVITGGGPGGASHLFTTLAYYLAFARFRFGQSAAVGVLLMAITGIPLLMLQYVRRRR